MEHAQRLTGPLTLPAKFTFTWMNIGFRGVIENDGDDGAMLRLAGDLGHVPFSVENLQRRAGLTKLCSLKILDDAGFEITSNLVLEFHHQIRLMDPPTPMLALSQITALLAQAKPYLDMVAR